MLINNYRLNKVNNLSCTAQIGLFQRVFTLIPPDFAKEILFPLFFLQRKSPTYAFPRFTITPNAAPLQYPHHSNYYDIHFL